MYGYDGIRSERVWMSGNVYIIAGPNGAGKTTFAREFLPLYAECRDFINADLIAQGIAPPGFSSTTRGKGPRSWPSLRIASSI